MVKYKVKGRRKWLEKCDGEKTESGNKTKKKIRTQQKNKCKKICYPYQSTDINEYMKHLLTYSTHTEKKKVKSQLHSSF